MMPWVKQKCISGLIISKEVKCVLKTNCIVAAIPQAELTKMMKKLRRLSLQTVVGPLTIFLK
jgi:predicted aconitase with swiveling domain